MLWILELADSAEKELSKIDKTKAALILIKIRDKILAQTDPTIYSDCLKYNFFGLWKLRVENFRIIFRILTDKKIVQVIKIGHRSNVYK